MEIQEIANKKACGGANAANTGKLGCLSLFGTPTHALALAKGTVIPKATTFDLAYLTPLIQQGKVIPLIEASDFEDLSAEDQYSTNTRGVKRLNLKGLPEYKLTFEEGHEFYRQLAKMEGYKNFDYILGDDEGNWMLATTSDGDYQGFSAGHSTPELTMRRVPGGEAESKSIVIQFLNRMQFDENYAILHQDELTFFPEEIPAVNGVNITFDSVPSAGTTFDITCVLSQDNNTLVEGIAASNFVLTINGGSDVIVSAVENTAGKYTITTTTALTATDVVGIDLWDSSLNVDVTDVSGVLYRSDVATETVV